MAHQQNYDHGGYESSKGSNADDLKDLKVPSADPLEFPEFLGFDRCPLTMPKVIPGKDTNILYLPWIHSPEKVPLVVEEIRNLLKERPQTKAVIVLSELVGPTEEQKHLLEDTFDRAVNSDVHTGSKVYRDLQGARIDGSKMNPLMFEKLKAFREIAWEGVDGQQQFIGPWKALLSSFVGADTGKQAGATAPLPVYVEFLDITDPKQSKAIFQVLREESSIAGARDLFLRTPLHTLREQLKFPAAPSDSQRAKAALELLQGLAAFTGAEQATLSRLISPLRNNTMASQIEQRRESSTPDELLVVLVGAGHSAVPFREVDQDDVGVRYIGLPNDLLLNLPSSFKHQTFSSLKMIGAMMRVEGEDLSRELLKKMVVEPFFSRYFYERLNGFPWTKHFGLQPELRNSEAVELLVRTTLLMTPELEMDIILSSFCSSVFDESFDGQTNIRVGDVMNGIFDAWILTAFPDYAEGRTKVDQGEFLNYAYEKYLKV